ncbi:MAG: hypothetical protein NVS4B6_12070 [Mycobacterium sp.]
MSQIKVDTRKVADLAEVYANASPDLWNGLQNAVRTAQTALVMLSPTLAVSPAAAPPKRRARRSR